MHKIFLAFFLIAIFHQASAQDVILQRNAQKIQAKIIKIDYLTIEYKKWDNLDGPTYTIPVAEVVAIEYQNGSKDEFQATSLETKKQTSHYQGEIGIGYGLEFEEGGHIVFETVHGIRFNPNIFTGIGAGINYNFYEGVGIIPVFINTKGYYPLSQKTSLYLSVDIGTAIDASGWGETGWYLNVGPGINFGNAKNAFRSDFSIRCQHLGENLNAILFRIGFSF